MERTTHICLTNLTMRAFTRLTDEGDIERATDDLHDLFVLAHDIGECPATLASDLNIDLDLFVDAAELDTIPPRGA